MAALYGVQQLLGNQYGRVYNKSTHETFRIEGASVEFCDDFLNTNLQTVAAGIVGWTSKITGAAPPTVAIVANQTGGVLGLNLTAADQKQEIGIYFGDALNFNLDKGLIFEARVTIHTAAPTLLSEAVFGLANAYVEGPIATDGPTIHAFFTFDGALTPTINTDDTSNDNNAVATGVTEVADTYSVFRIDASSAASVKFYIDGVRVASSTTFDMSTGGNVVLQPYLLLHKESGAGEGIMYIEYVKVWQLAR